MDEEQRASEPAQAHYARNFSTTYHANIESLGKTRYGMLPLTVPSLQEDELTSPVNRADSLAG